MAITPSARRTIAVFSFCLYAFNKTECVSKKTFFRNIFFTKKAVGNRNSSREYTTSHSLLCAVKNIARRILAITNIKISYQRLPVYLDVVLVMPRHRISKGWVMPIFWKKLWVSSFLSVVMRVTSKSFRALSTSHVLARL